MERSLVSLSLPPNLRGGIGTFLEKMNCIVEDEAKSQEHRTLAAEASDADLVPGARWLSDTFLCGTSARPRVLRRTLAKHY
jgi:hypothetical protein